jgi:hypothetical protein
MSAWLVHLLKLRLTSGAFWLLLAALSALSGWLLLIQVEQFLGAQARVAAASASFGVTPMVLLPYLGNLKLLVLLALPLLLGALLAAEEHTASLWLGVPLSDRALAAGVLLCALSLSALWWGVLLAGAAALRLGAPLDMPLALSAWFGLALLLAFFAALHALIVCHVRGSAAALLASLAVNLAFALTDLAARAQALKLQELGLMNPLAHFGSFLSGRPTISGMVLVAGFIGVSWLLITRRIARLRQGR